MSILSAKLKLYNICDYDDRRFVIAVFICMITGLLGSALYGLRIEEIIKNQQCILRPLINFFTGMFFSGVIAAIIQMEIISKPFSFCLPDRQKSIRKVIFLIGGLIIYGFSLISFIFSKHTLLIFFLHVIALPIIGLPFYFLTAFIVFNTQNNSLKKYIGYCFPAVAFILSLSFIINLKNDLTVPLNQMIVFCFAPLFISSLFGISALWNVLGDDQAGRIFFRKVFGLPDNQIIAGKKAHELSQQQINNQNEIIGDFFVKKIVNQSAFSLIRSVLGTFYLLLERVCGYSGKSLTAKIILPSLFIFLFGYLQNNKEVDHFLILYSICCFLFIYSRKIISIYKLPPQELLLPIGRAKQFQIGLALWFVKPITMMLWFFFITVASHSLSNYMPNFTVAGYHFSYTPLVVHLIFWPAVIFPVIDIYISFPKPPCSLVTMVGLILTLVVLNIFFFVGSDRMQEIISMTLMILISNIFYLILLTRFWFRRDNV